MKAHLVAAVVGFLARLMALSSSNDAVEDYGPNFARVLIVPFFAGLAGVLRTRMPFVSTEPAQGGSSASG